MHGLLRCPPFAQFICGRMWCRRVLPAALPATLSATLSPALWVYLCKWGPQGLLVLGLPAPFVPHSASLSPSTATRVLSTPVPVSAPPTSLDECLFSISLVSVPLTVRFSVLVVQGGAVCLPTPPSWFLSHHYSFKQVFYPLLFLFSF